MAGLLGAVAGPDGTAAMAFAGFPLGRVPVAGKTGTAQVSGRADTSLFVAVAPAGDPRFAVAAVVEEAGFGSAVAAPIVRRVLEVLTPEAGVP
jgi:penicillin-binding protein 2